jgi:hypothetical protein
MKPPTSSLARVLLGFATILPTVVILALLLPMFGPFSASVIESEDLFFLTFAGWSGSILLWNLLSTTWR